MNRKLTNPWKIIRPILLVLTLCASFAPASPTLALEQLSVDIGQTANLINAGQAVELQVRVVCTVENSNVLEGFVYVVQNGNQSNFAPIPVTCDDHPRVRVLTITVTALDFVFQKGEANSSAFLLVTNTATGAVLSASDGEAIWIR